MKSLGDGHDLLNDRDGLDSVQFGADITVSGLDVSRDGDHLAIRYSAADRVTINNWFTALNHRVESFTFDNGDSLTPLGLEALIRQETHPIAGTKGKDTLEGTEDRDTLDGRRGNDTFMFSPGDGYDRFFGGGGFDRIVASDTDDVIGIYNAFGADSGIEEIDGGTGINRIQGSWHSSTLDFSDVMLTNIDSIHGGNGKDVITGTAGNDMIIGGRGQDTLYGGPGDDRYRMYAGDGPDRIGDRIGMDTVTFASVDHDRLWLERSDDDLIIATLGTRDRVTIDDWYRHTAHQIECFETADARMLSNADVDQLVEAMAGFTTPAFGQTELLPDIREELAPTLAASW